MDRRRRRKVASLLLTVLLALAGLQAPATPQPTRINAAPELLALAKQRPAQQLRLIVQRAGTGQALERAVAALGGEVLSDLSIINALVVALPASQLDTLARSQNVRWIAWDAPAVSADDTSGQSGGTSCADCINTANLRSPYIRVIGADRVWNSASYLQGQGVGVAIIDSGIGGHPDLDGRVVKQVKFNSTTSSMSDGYGHGTHIAGIIGGSAADGGYLGVAPRVKVISVKVSDDTGAAYASDVVAGMQWVYENRAAHNIRVVNLSLNSAVAESYHTSPINAAAEILWFNGMVVVASAGNTGTGGLFPPANDPFVITVGATDARGTVATGDDVLASFSAYGTSGDGIRKPDIVAPGTQIVSLLTSKGGTLATSYPGNIVGSTYFRMSGTSVSAPMVAGAAALLLQDEPHLTPDQVKHRLMSTARPVAFQGAGAGYLNIPAAIDGTSTGSANTGIQASKLLWSGSEPVTWNSVSWNSVSWNSVSWNSVSWNSVSWNSVSWNSTYWGSTP